MRISIIAAIGSNRELGKDNRLPWHIPEDFQRFRKITTGHPVIMGRKTFESLGRPLADRLNIIVTRDPGYRIPDASNTLVARSLEEAIATGRKFEKEELFIIGGGQIFEQSLPMADRLYLTVVEGTFDADTFFPDYPDFKKVIFKESRESAGYRYRFLELER